MKEVIQTDKAPKAIGTYSQAVRCGDFVHCSGQIPLVPETMEIAGEDADTQIRQVFSNLQAVAKAAGGNLSDFVKLNVYLKNLSDFPLINTIMMDFFQAPYPARAAVGVAQLPRESLVEIEGILYLPR